MQIFEFVIANFHLAHLKIQQSGLESKSIGAVVKDVYDEIYYQDFSESQVQSYVDNVAKRAHSDLTKSVKKHKSKQFGRKKEDSQMHDLW